MPYIVHEADMARMERSNKRLWIALILAIILLVGSNIAWTVYENQFADEVSETVETIADNGGNAYGTIVSGENSEVHYGDGQSNAD